MSEVWILAPVWIFLAFLSTFISVWLGIATALLEIIARMIAQAIILAYFGGLSLGNSESWIKFLAGSGAIVLIILPVPSQLLRIIIISSDLNKDLSC